MRRGATQGGALRALREALEQAAHVIPWLNDARRLNLRRLLQHLADYTAMFSGFGSFIGGLFRGVFAVWAL